MKDTTGTRELSYAELEHRVKQLLQIIDANDQYMQEEEHKIEDLKNKVCAFEMLFERGLRNDTFYEG